MTTSRMIGAAALLAAVVTAPAIAQEAMQQPSAYAQAHPWVNVYNYRYRPGLWPGDVAANIAAVDTIATVPLRATDPTTLPTMGTDPYPA